MKKYVLFDAIIDINHTLPLATSAKELLKVLNLEIPILGGVSRDRGLESIGEDKETFFRENAKTLALATKEKSDIVCVEDSSFLSLRTTLEKLKEDEKLANLTIKELEKNNLELNLDIKIFTLADFIIKEFGMAKLKKNISKNFKNFLVALYLGSYQCQIQRYSDIKSYSKLLEATELKLIDYNLKNQVCGYDIYDTNEQLACEMAGALMLDMFDNAADFVVINDARSFAMFDEHQKELEKSVGREIGLTVLCLAEVLLLALGITDKKRIGLDNHVIKTKIV
ncbi:MAG: heterodisulfide reductase [Sulfurospirillum sp.]